MVYEKFSLNRDLISLLKDEPLLSSLSCRIKKKESYEIETAGVCIDADGYYQLLFNPDFFESLPEAHRIGVIKHELYHILLDHLEIRFKWKGEDPQKLKMMNIATDLAINSFLRDELPDEGIFPEEGPFSNLPAGQSAEWYLKELDKLPKSMFDDINTAGCHESWGDGDGSLKKVADERLKKAINEAMKTGKRYANGGYGSVPKYIQKKIEPLLVNTVNWKRMLKMFLEKSSRGKRVSSRRRINKRFPYIYSGHKRSREANIVVAIDQSGSVDDAMLATFFGELANVSKFIRFTVVPFSTEVLDEHVFVWEKGMKPESDRVFYGGTCFDAPTNWVNERKGYDGIIIMTDMVAPPSVKCKVRRLWVTDSYGISYDRENNVSGRDRVIEVGS